MTFRARLAEEAQGLKRELEVYRRVLGDARTPWLPKLLLGLAVGYAVLPFDLIPDFVPVIGHLDDLIVVPVLVILALRLLPAASWTIAGGRGAPSRNRPVSAPGRPLSHAGSRALARALEGRTADRDPGNKDAIEIALFPSPTAKNAGSIALVHGLLNAGMDHNTASQSVPRSMYSPYTSPEILPPAGGDMSIDWQGYDSGDGYDELIASGGAFREAAEPLCRYLASLSTGEIEERKRAADLSILTMGVTFTVYTEEGGSIDRAWPFDIIPRILSAQEWVRTEAGLKQRVHALNLFIDDLYHDQRIVKDGVLPAWVMEKSANFRPECTGVDPPHGVWAHVCGSDLVRDRDGTLYVLEDNLRIPSGVSYMLENRLVTKRVFPELFEHVNIRPIDDYPAQLFDMLCSLSPRPGDSPEIVVLTPGIYNSAYFEHAYLAQQMGAELVEGSDLFVGDDECVYMRTIEGPARVNVIYRRIDDLFLDPETFGTESVIGVPGLLRAWKKGKVGLANAPGAGVADDKVVYAFVPKAIKYYLDEEPILPNVPTYLCMDPRHREYVLANLDKLVVKPANASGGYGLLVGPHATATQRAQFTRLIEHDPRDYIAQPVISLSTVPTLCEEGLGRRHVDLRPFILSGAASYVTMGGLTRVALRRGSLVVNSSQGGGSKDTWVVDCRAH
jgi:uncharacterized circularly permuted ATP-grasp superfamily protein/uncharacterized membrane protein YkvA (DUF1232 family)